MKVGPRCSVMTLGMVVDKKKSLFSHFAAATRAISRFCDFPIADPFCHRRMWCLRCQTALITKEMTNIVVNEAAVWSRLIVICSVLMFSPIEHKGSQKQLETQTNCLSRWSTLKSFRFRHDGRPMEMEIRIELLAQYQSLSPRFHLQFSKLLMSFSPAQSKFQTFFGYFYRFEVTECWRWRCPDKWQCLKFNKKRD